MSDEARKRSPQDAAAFMARQVQDQARSAGKTIEPDKARKIAEDALSRLNHR